jgi:antitoxin CcdA
MNVKRPVSKKKGVNLSIDERLLADSRQAGLNLSKVLEERLRELRIEAFKRQIAPTIDDFNKRMEEEGLWSDSLRLL